MDAKKPQTVSPEQRELMISEAAFYLAERNGFQGDPVVDWLLAEIEIDTVLQAEPAPKRKPARKKVVGAAAKKTTPKD